MALVALPGSPSGFLGPNPVLAATTIASTGVTLDAANEAGIFVGRVKTSDGASHTIDTSGSSSLQWRTVGATFANAGTTLIVGLADVDAAAGPPARAANVADVITFDVSRSMTGGGGGVSANAWQAHTPTSGSKTIADGDLVAFAVQMTARGGADTVAMAYHASASSHQRPTVTTFTGGSYATVSALPDAIIVFSDGALGYFFGSEVFSTQNTRTYNNAGAQREYGQLFTFDFPCRVQGIYGWLDPDGDADFILYSDPLGTPVAERTVTVDANVVAATAGRRFTEYFASGYDVAAGQVIAVAAKPTSATNISLYYKTLGHADHRVADMWGTSGYGVTRGSSGAFANANSSLDHYYIGLLIGGFDDGAGGGGLAQLVNNGALVG